PPVVLQPGQMSRVPGDAAAPTAPVAAGEPAAWRTGAVLFDDQPIGVILNEVERRFDVRVEARPAALRRVRISLVADRVDSAEEVLAMIAGARGLTYRAVEGGYVLLDPAAPRP